METKEIEIKDIKEAVFKRTVYDQRELRSLGENILENGQLQPVRVAPIEDGGYNLIYGSQRLEACKICDIPMIRADVLDSPIGEIEGMVLNTIENGQRRNLNLYDTARQIRKLVELGVKKGDIAKINRKANSWVSDTLKVLDMPNDVVNSVKKGEIGIAQIRELHNIPDKKKLEILPQIRNSTVRKTVQEIAQQHKMNKLEIDLKKITEDLEYYKEKMTESIEAESERGKVTSRINRLKLEQKRLITRFKSIDKKGELNKLLTSIARLDKDYYPILKGITTLEEKIEMLIAESGKLEYDEESFKKLEVEHVKLISKKADLNQQLIEINSKLGVNNAKYGKIKEVIKDIESINDQIDTETKTLEKQKEKIKDIEESYKTVINNIDSKRMKAKKFKAELQQNEEIAREIVKLTKEEGQLRGRANNKKAHEEKIEKLNVHLRGLQAELKKSK
jgi:ParB family chromosome partitioning protein